MSSLFQANSSSRLRYKAAAAPMDKKRIYEGSRYREAVHFVNCVKNPDEP
jgi:hypothetical protein